MSVPAALLVAGTLLLAIVFRYLLALEQTAPWLMGDELRYAEMAKSFLDEGRLLFREEFTSFASAYPALIAPAWAAVDIETAYEIAKAINVVLMTSVAVVVFFWMRRLAPTAYALTAAGLVLLMPTFTYTGMLMTENAALPAFLLAMFVMAVALERETVVWQLAVFAAIALAALMRVQIATLALVYPTAILLDALFTRRAGVRSLRDSLRRFAPAFGALVAGTFAYVAYRLLAGGSLTAGLGAYDAVAEAEYDKVDVARWSIWHAGELVLSVGVLPAITFGVLLTGASRRGGLGSAAERAFVSMTAATTFWFILQAAAFASWYSDRIEERYMVYAAPLLLMALPITLARSIQVSSLATFAAVLVPSLLVMTIPFERMFAVPILADTFGLIPFLRLSAFLDGGVGDVELAVAVGLAIVGVSFLALSRRVARFVFPAAVAMFLVLSSYTVHGAIEVQSAGARGASGVPDPSWVDHLLGSSARVGFIFSAGVAQNPHLLWQSEFWNRSVRGVYAYGTGADPTYGGRELTLDARGRLVPGGSRPVPVHEPYVLADPSLSVVGDVVARPGPLALIRVERPIRIASTVAGMYADGWSGPRASFSQFEPLPDGRRRIRLRVSRAGWRGPDLAATVAIAAGPLEMTAGGPTIARVTAARRWTVHSGQSRTFVIPVPPAPFGLEVRMRPTFSPAQFGQGDTRQLGAQLTFPRSE